MRADATGRLAATPLADMLISLLERRMTGSLVIQDPAGPKSAFTVQQGAIIKARTANPVIRIGDLLLEFHVLEPKMLERGLRHARQAKVPLGQALLRIQAIAEPTLHAALAEQLSRRVVWACGLPPESRYGFYAEADFLANWGAGPIQADPLGIIWRTARSHANQNRVSSVLERLASRPVRLHTQARLDRFDFDEDDVKPLEPLGTEMVPVVQLLRAQVADPESLRRMVYVLALTRHLDLGDGHQPAGTGEGAPPEGISAAASRLALGNTRVAPAQRVVSTSPPRAAATPMSVTPPSSTVPVRSVAPSVPSVVAPPPSAMPLGPVTISPPAHAPAAKTAPPSRASSSPPNARARRSVAPRASSTAPPRSRTSARPDPLEWRLNAKVAQCDRRDFYALLEVDRNAAPGTIQAAFVKLAKVWHPDKLPPGMAHRRDDATRLFARLSEARRVLCDTELRATYDHEHATGETEEETVTRVVEAAQEFRKAELLVKRNDYAAALPHAEAAYKADEEQPEYAALYAFVVAQCTQELEPSRLEELAGIADAAATADKENVRVRYYRGFVLKRAGRQEEAIREFKYVARHDRHNVDALREIRIYNLRREREQQKPSFLGGLFGTPKPSTPPKSRR